MGKEDVHTTTPRNWRLLKPEARRQRHEPTQAEDALWQFLRGKQLGERFRRQHAIDRFIADFVCLSRKLVAEVDGSSHEGLEQRDRARDAVMCSAGFKVIRFTNQQVLTGPNQVLAAVRAALSRTDQ
jgi:very-short-patch-repair endonuclease